MAELGNETKPNKAWQYFYCPKCNHNTAVPCKTGPRWNVYPITIICSECNRDITKEFYVRLVMQGQKFKKSKYVNQARHTPKNNTEDIPDENLISFDEALLLLKPKERMFLLEYIKDFNGTRAAKAAGYTTKSARFAASKLATMSNIQFALRCYLKDRKEQVKVSVDDIVRELVFCGFSRITNLMSFTQDGLTYLKPSDELEEKDLAAIESIQFTETMTGISTKLKLQSKVPALKALGEYLGMFEGKSNRRLAPPVTVSGSNVNGTEPEKKRYEDRIREFHSDKLVENIQAALKKLGLRAVPLIENEPKTKND